MKKLIFAAGALVLAGCTAEQIALNEMRSNLIEQDDWFALDPTQTALAMGERAAEFAEVGDIRDVHTAMVRTLTPKGGVLTIICYSQTADAFTSVGFVGLGVPINTSAEDGITVNVSSSVSEQDFPFTTVGRDGLLHVDGRSEKTDLAHLIAASTVPVTLEYNGKSYVFPVDDSGVVRATLDGCQTSGR